MEHTKYIVMPRDFVYIKENDNITTDVILLSDSDDVYFYQCTCLPNLYFAGLKDTKSSLFTDSKPNESLINGLKCLINSILGGQSDSVAFNIITHWQGKENSDTLVSLSNSLKESLSEFPNISIKVGYLSSKNASRIKQYDGIVELIKKRVIDEQILRILDACIIQDAESDKFDKNEKLKGIHNKYQKCLINRFLCEKPTNPQAMQEAQSELTEAMKELEPSFTGLPWDADIDAIHKEYNKWLNRINQQS
ncbi:MAG: hypothetical protein PHO37_14985 [Kiritimatiellae bacterium]|nr:hypothetical protein [Kiritimatiellia bacterium]